MTLEVADDLQKAGGPQVLTNHSKICPASELRAVASLAYEFALEVANEYPTDSHEGNAG